LESPADIPGLGDVSDIINDFLPGFNTGAAEECSKQADVFNKLAEECTNSLNGGVNTVCTKECDAFFKKTGEGDCGEFYKGLGLDYLFDICSDGKLDSEDFQDINVPGVSDTTASDITASDTTASDITASDITASDTAAGKNVMMGVTAVVGATLAFTF
jgi:hypothetical protein